jgi:hypothetical protein
MYFNRLISGKMKCSLFDKSYEFQFIDYIYGGCDISVVLAMDFSVSNLRYSNPASLHYVPRLNSQLKGDLTHDGSYMDFQAANAAGVRVTTRVEQLIKNTRAAG